MSNVANRNSGHKKSGEKKQIFHFEKQTKINKELHYYRRHSIFEYFLPDGFEMGNLARSISKARFISRIRVRSRSHAVFLYSKIV